MRFLYFTAAWCGPCRQVTPVFERLSQEFGEQMEFEKIDVDLNQELAREMKVFAIPSFKVVEGGKVVREKVGLQTEAELRDLIQG